MHRNHFISFILLFGLSLILIACQAVPSGPAAILAKGAPSPVFTATFTPFQASSPTLVPTLTPTPTQIPTATPQPCLSQSGQIEQKELTFPGRSLPFDFRVYTPPCFDPTKSARYPVLYMIHGQTFSDDQWERIGIGAAADALIQAKKSLPFIIVMPRERDTYADIYVESFGPDVISNLIPWIDANYPTCAERACRAIGGLSRGGAWALHLGFTHWQLFSAIGLHSTPPFNTDPGYFPIWVRDIPADQMPRVYMDAGRKDPFLSMASSFEEQLVRYGVPHEWYIFNGTHEEAYWSAHVSDYLEWYAQGWKDLPQESLSR